jgi:hypothetical protein
MSKLSFGAAVGCAVVASVAVAASTLGAQTLAGRITRGGQPLGGAIVNLLAPNGAVAARAASREGGRYSVTAPAPGAYRVQIVQIGWRPSVAGPYTLGSGATVAANIDATSQRISLDAMVINDRTECRLQPDSTADAFVLWAEARKALEAATMTRAEPLTMSVTRSERTLDRGAARVVADSTKTLVGLSLNPFVTLPADALATNGYVTADATGERMYWAPDADVLISESFVATHCLRVERPAAQMADADHLIGVGFAPASKRKNVIDVEGVVWLDRTSGELRSMDYKYVNTSNIIQRADPRGRLEFLRIPGGRWIADRWSIRVPIVGTRMQRDETPVAPGMPRGETAMEDLVGVHVTSAQVSEIRRDNRVLWERGHVTLIVRVVDSTSAPVRGVLVAIAGSAGTTATDSEGVVRIDRVSPGPVTLRLETSELATVGLSPLAAPADVPPMNDATVIVRVPSPRTLVAARCGQRSLDWGEGMLRGTTAGTAPVRVTWQTAYARLGGGDPVIAEELRDVTPAANGEFIICGVPRDATVSVRKAGALAGGAVTTRFAAGAVAASVAVP